MAKRQGVDAPSHNDMSPPLTGRFGKIRLFSSVIAITALPRVSGSCGSARNTVPIRRSLRVRWVRASFYGAYMLSVPLLVTLTDRVDHKRVYLFGVAATVAGHLWFGLLAEGFWSALTLRALTGMGWAGTYGRVSSSWPTASTPR